MVQKGAKNRLFLSILKTGTPPVCAAGPEKTEILIFFAKKSQFNTGYNEKKTLRFRLGFYWGEIPGKNHDFYEKGVTPPRACGARGFCRNLGG